MREFNIIRQPCYVLLEVFEVEITWKTNYPSVICMTWNLNFLTDLLHPLANIQLFRWRKKESARAKLRVLVRRVLKKYGYPPDLTPAAASTELSQAEALLKWGDPKV